MMASRPRRLDSLSQQALERIGLDHYASSVGTYDDTDRALAEWCYKTCSDALIHNRKWIAKCQTPGNGLIFDIVYAREPNAIAWCEERQDLICINAGLPIALYSLFYLFLSRKSNAFSWREHSSLRSGRETPLPTIPTSFTLPTIPTSFVSAAKAADSLPGPLQRELIHTLFYWSLQFILFHELAHIGFGHVRHAQAQLGRRSFPELGARQEAGQLPSAMKISQAESNLRVSQEQQADGFVTETLLPALLHGKGKLRRAVFEDSADRVIYAWYFMASTVYTLFFMMDDGARSIGRPTHPPPLLRLTDSMFGASLLKGMEINTLVRNMDQAWRDVDDLFATVFGNGYRKVWKNDRRVIVDIDFERVGLRKFPHRDEWRKYERIKLPLVLKVIAYPKTHPLKREVEVAIARAALSPSAQDIEARLRGLSPEIGRLLSDWKQQDEGQFKS